MERISFTMTADNDGKITVKNVLEYIMQNIPQIKVPDVENIYLLILFQKMEVNT